MKKVLIISYFFPPNNFTASNRVYGFAKILNKFGYHPIVITRNWNLKIKNIQDTTKPSGSKMLYEKNTNYEVYYLPYYGSLRDKFQVHFQSRFSFFRKFLSFLELILENFGLFFIPHNSFYRKAKQIITQQDVNHLVISGSPFNQFYYGFLLKKNFPFLKWVADYRDEWTSRTLFIKKGLLNNLILKIQTKNEKKWVAKADKIIGVSKQISENIANYLSNPNYDTIENGFFQDDYISLTKKSKNTVFTISYTGAIYEKQNFSIFLEALKEIILEFKSDLSIKLQFIGLKGNIVNVNYINEIMQGFHSNISFTERVDRKKCIELEYQSDLLLMVAYGDLKGIPSSKLYQYIGSQNNIFLCPNDNDIIEKYLLLTKQGVIANDSKEAYFQLKKLVENHLSGKVNQINIEEIKKFSRKHQTKKLAKILDSL